MLIVYSFFFVLFLWCYIKTLATDPGQIPLYWGFKKSDSAETRKRYCIICNIFKPERTHHCSTCDVCVLNMDHHCPWLNSCIGFWNWKSFILMLIYLNLLLQSFLARFYYKYYEIGKEVSFHDCIDLGNSCYLRAQLNILIRQLVWGTRISVSLDRGLLLHRGSFKVHLVPSRAYLRE